MHPLRLIERLHYFLCYRPEAYTYVNPYDLERLRRRSNVLFHTQQLVLKSGWKPTLLTYLVSYLVYTKYDIEVDYGSTRRLVRQVGIILKAPIFSKELEFLQALNYDLSFLYLEM
jgi:hypothetical protein